MVERAGAVGAGEVWRPLLRLAGLLLLLVLLPGPAWAQAGLLATPGQSAQGDAVPALPDDLTPEMVDGLLSRLTDADIRALLREELVRRAEERAEAEAQSIDALQSASDRLEQMLVTIDARVARWITALANIGERREKIAERLARAEGGVGAMLAAAAAVGLAGFLVALAIARVTRDWRRWLAAAADAGYWDRVVRTLALLVLELAPIVGFVLATVVVAEPLGGWLGPLVDYVWIYHVGVSNGWGFIVIARRAFAPDAAAIRIAPLSDQGAAAVHALLRHSVLIGMAGWLLAGLSPTLGLGFPPAIITMALAGTAVAGLLLASLLRHHTAISKALSDALRGSKAGEVEEASGSRVVAAAGPALLGGYILVAWLYWLGHWLERGVQRLEGPAGTLIVLLLLPILNRLGSELVNSVLRVSSDTTERFRQVFRSAWRALLGIIAVFVVADLWGLDLLALTKGPLAPAWASMLFDVVVTLLVGQLLWRLIKAALYREKPPESGDEEDEEAHEIAPQSRLDTLLPLFRNVLLGILVIVVFMIVLSSLGVDIGPLLASAGIIGIAIGFGAQTLVRDIFSGAFFLIDDAFRVGEYIELEQDLRGEVEAISIRSLRLRHHRGPVITIPFGELKSVTNHNRDWVIYKMNFRMEPDTDPQQVKKTVKEVGKELWNHPEHGPKFIEPLKSQGVYMIDEDSALVIRVKFMCKPRAQFVLRREIYHRLREVFAERGLKLARRKVEVVSGDGGPPPDDLTVKGGLPEDILSGQKQ